MGTNYYLERSAPSHEGACGHCTENTMESIHLGKTSVGWKFGFYADPSWDRSEAIGNWLNLTLSGKIVNDYGSEIPRGDLLGLIMRKQGLKSHLVDHGKNIAGPYFKMFSAHNFDCDGFDFTDSEFS